MITKPLLRLQFLCKVIPELLLNLDETELTYKAPPNKWSKKEILGHLIDSATNNHQRFVRAQFEDTPTITYNQDNWNTYSYYNKLESTQLIQLWTTYNKHLGELMSHIPIHLLLNQCDTGLKENKTIAWLFEDYVSHLEYHLKQIVSY